MRQEESIFIRRPLPDVVAYVSDASRASEWSDGLTRVELPPGFENKVGARFRMTIKEGAKESWYDAEVIALDASRRRLRVTRDGFLMETEFAYEPESEGTRLTEAVEYDLKGGQKLFLPIAWLFNRSILRKQTRKIKSVLESEA